MGDIITFIFIGIVIYKIFSRKDRAPQRRPARTEDYRQPVRPARPVTETRKTAPKKENIFESIERQIKESAEKLERDLHRDSEEGYSDYDKYVSAQGTQGVEGTAGYEGSAGSEGSAGDEGSWGKEGLAYREGAAVSGKAKKTANKRSAPPEPRQPEIKEQRPEAGAVPVLGFSSQEIVQGVIWAEILKKPRERNILSRRF